MLFQRPVIAFLFVTVSAIAVTQTSAHAQDNALSKAELQLNWAACIEMSDQPDLNIAACLRIIRQGYETPENLSVAYQNLGAHSSRKNDLNNAIHGYSEAIRWNPKNAQAWTDRGVQYRIKKEYKRAIEDHTKAIEIDGNHKDAWYNRGNVYAETGDKERAIADYRQALKINPNDEDARKNLRHLGASE